jgi:hypothetical protein
MSIVKDIQIKTVTSQVANEFVKQHHYSGKVVNNSQLHLGAFYNGILHGVMQFGPSLDKRKMQGLVKNTKWNDFIELNRMAFDDYLPKNSESRCIAIAMKLLKKHAPNIKWVVSFADGTQCGDGTIYRASGFILTSIKKNNQMWQAPTGDTFSRMSLTDHRSKQQQQQARAIVSRLSDTKSKYILETGGSTMKPYIDAGWQPIEGYQLRYIYLIDKSCQLTVPILPFSKIDDMGANMYKGMRQKYSSDTADYQLAEGGAEPTLTHQIATPQITAKEQRNA